MECPEVVLAHMPEHSETEGYPELAVVDRWVADTAHQGGRGMILAGQSVLMPTRLQLADMPRENFHVVALGI